eukprot:2427614-Pleurochrysis_carterae.AAC.1
MGKSAVSDERRPCINGEALCSDVLALSHGLTFPFWCTLNLRTARHFPFPKCASIFDALPIGMQAPSKTSDLDTPQ